MEIMLSSPRWQNENKQAKLKVQFISNNVRYRRSKVDRLIIGKINGLIT